MNNNPNGNNNNNNNNNNVVAPTVINLNNVTTNNADTMLNRERDNIVSATIQANSNIDKKQALEINNQIQVDKHPKYMYGVVIATIAIVTIAVGVVAFMFTKHVTAEPEVSSTTTTTTTAPIERFRAYLTNYSKVRKFVGKEYILMLSNEGVDIKNNREHYLLLHTSSNGLLESKNGTYTIENDTIKLDNEVFEYDKDGIKYNAEVLKIFDSEMKYYQYKDNDVSYTLIINATMKNEFSMFITSSSKGTNVKLQTFKETDSSITLGDNTVFAKSNDGITYNNYTLKMAS